MLLARRHLFQDHRQRIRLSANGAARAPDIELGRARQQIGNDVRLKLRELLRRAEELRDVDRQIFDESVKLRLVLRRHIEILRIRIVALARHKTADTPLHLRLLVEIKVDLRLRLELPLECAPILIVQHIPFTSCRRGHRVRRRLSFRSAKSAKPLFKAR